MKNYLFNFLAVVSFMLLASFSQPVATNAPEPASALNCNLPAPGTFSPLVSPGSVTLSWSAVSGAVSYNLKVYYLSGGTPVYIGESVESGLGVTKGGLTSGVTYRFVLASMCSSNSVSDYVIFLDSNP